MLQVVQTLKLKESRRESESIKELLEHNDEKAMAEKAATGQKAAAEAGMGHLSAAPENGNKELSGGSATGVAAAPLARISSMTSEGHLAESWEPVASASAARAPLAPPAIPMPSMAFIQRKIREHHDQQKAKAAAE